MNYGKYVKEMYWPKVSEKNQLETAKLRDRAVKENTIKQSLKGVRPSYAPGDRPWRVDLINKS